MRSLGLLALGAILACGAAACGDDRAAPAPRDEVLTFTFDGVERTVLVHAPAGGKELALVLDLHPSGGTAASQREATKLRALADREGFAVAYPQAAIAHDGGYQWHVPGSPLVGGQPEPAGPDDVAFIAEAIERIDRALGGRVDRARIFATGFSGGARMSSSLGCALPQLRAIAPIGGVRAPEPCPRAGLSVNRLPRHRRQGQLLRRTGRRLLDVRRGRGDAALGRAQPLRRRAGGDAGPVRPSSCAVIRAAPAPRRCSSTRWRARRMSCRARSSRAS